MCFREVSLRKISPGGRSGISNSRASQNLPMEEKTNSGALTTLMRFCLKTRRFEIALESGSKGRKRIKTAIWQARMFLPCS